MSNEIATYGMIKTKTTYGSDSNEAPTKTEIKAISLYLVIANESSYGDNECVKIDDISAMKEETRYNFSVTPTTMSFTAAGGTKSFTVTSSKLTYLNGVAQGTATAVSHTNSITGSGFSLSDDKVVASSNTGTSDRSGTVTVKLAETSNTKTISLTQSGDTISSYGDWVVTVSANPTTLPASGGTSTITASAKRTVYWVSGNTTTENATPTLSINGAGFTLSGTTVTAANNSSESSRSCTVTATSNGKSATYTITQNGLVPFSLICNIGGFITSRTGSAFENVKIIAESAVPTTITVTLSIGSSITGSGSLVFNIPSGSKQSRSLRLPLKPVYSNEDVAFNAIMAQSSTTISPSTYGNYKFNLAYSLVSNGGEGEVTPQTRNLVVIVNNNTAGSVIKSPSSEGLNSTYKSDVGAVSGVT